MWWCLRDNRLLEINDTSMDKCFPTWQIFPTKKGRILVTIWASWKKTDALKMINPKHSEAPCYHINCYQSLWFQNKAITVGQVCNLCDWISPFRPRQGAAQGNSWQLLLASQRTTWLTWLTWPFHLPTVRLSDVDFMGVIHDVNARHVHITSTGRFLPDGFLSRATWNIQKSFVNRVKVDSRPDDLEEYLHKLELEIIGESMPVWHQERHANYVRLAVVNRACHNVPCGSKQTQSPCDDNYIYSIYNPLCFDSSKLITDQAL